MEKQQQPHHEIRLGKIRATIWANQREGEEAWYRITVSRLFKDGDQWRNTVSFRPDDLPILGKVLDLAHDWLFSQAGSDTQPEEKRKENASNGVKNRERRHYASKKQGNGESARGRVLMRQSKGDQLDLARGAKRGSAVPSERKTKK